MAKSKGRLLSELAEAPKNEDYSDVNALPNTGNKVGDQAFVEETDRLYIWNGSGWYNIALINTTPTWDSGGQPASSYELSADSPQTATSITLAASDPEGLPISYTYVTGGSMDSIATISQDSSVFTITPKTLSQVPDGGTGSITFRASDGINILPQVSSFTLNFISTIQNSKHTTLLVTAVDTSDNNNITDSSSNNHTPTLINPADALKQGSFSPYRSGGYSLSFNGTNESFEPNHSSASGLGTTWSFSFWAYIPTSGVTNNSPYVVDFYRSGGGDDSFAMQVFTSTKKIELTTRVYGVSYGGVDYGLATATNLTCFDKWSYYVVTHSSGTTTLYIDGSSAGTSTGSAFSSIEASSVQNLMLGARKVGSSSEFAKMDIRDFHLKSEVHNGAVNNEPAVADSSTIILAAHKPNLAAQTGASTALVPVINNSVSTKPFSPYDYLEYAAADHGGNIQSTNSNDSSAGRTGLSFADHADFDLAGSDWTFEWWAYVPESSGVNNLNFVQKGASGAVRPYSFNYRLESGQPGWEPRMFGSSNGSSQWEGYSGAAWQPWSTWTHVAFVRNGSTITRYINGKAYGTGTGDVFDNNEVLYVGGGYGDEQPHTYSDLRISKSAVYTTDFTPPTAPLSSSGASLHIKGTDASIIDKSQGTNLLIDGTTITGVSTGSKYSKAIKNTAASSAIKVCTPSEFNMRTNNDFTIEFWFKVDPTSSYSATNYPKYILQIQYGGIVFGIWANPSTTKIEGNGARTDGSSYITWSSSMFTSYTPNQWHHYALSFDKSNTTAKWFLDGSLYHTDTSYDDPSTSVTNSNGTYMVSLFGETGTVNSNTGFIGSIEDFRFSQFTRYTANFTPPTASLEG